MFSVCYEELFQKDNLLNKQTALIWLIHSLILDNKIFTYIQLRVYVSQATTQWHVIQ